jgi:hypothetical protein
MIALLGPTYSIADIAFARLVIAGSSSGATGRKKRGYHHLIDPDQSQTAISAAIYIGLEELHVKRWARVDDDYSCHLRHLEDLACGIRGAKAANGGVVCAGILCLCQANDFRKCAQSEAIYRGTLSVFSKLFVRHSRRSANFSKNSG